MKCRWQKEDIEAGIEVLQVVKRGSHYSKSKYKVLFSCGHIGIITGNSMNSRKNRCADGVESSLCRTCSLKNKAAASKKAVQANQLTAPPARRKTPHERRVDKMLSMICEYRPA